MKTSDYNLNNLNPSIPLGITMKGYQEGHKAAHLVPKDAGHIKPRKDILRDVRYCLEQQRDKFPLLFGPTGTGKTKFVRSIAQFLNYPLVSISCNSEMEPHSLFGQFVLDQNGGMAFSLAALSIAFKEGYMLFLDEIDNLSPETSFALKGILSGGSITIPETGEVIERHPRFILVGASNTNLGGDESGLYTGQAQSKALSRHFFFIPFGYMPMQDEKEILIEKHPDFGELFISDSKLVGKSWVKNISDEMFPGIEKAINDQDSKVANDIVSNVILDKLLEVAATTREQFLGNPLSDCEKNLETVIDTGSLIAWVGAIQAFGKAPNAIQYALERTVTFGASLEHRRVIHQIAQNILGDLWEGS